MVDLTIEKTRKMAESCTGLQVSAMLIVSFYILLSLRKMKQKTSTSTTQSGIISRGPISMTSEVFHVSMQQPKPVQNGSHPYIILPPSLESNTGCFPIQI